MKLVIDSKLSVRFATLRHLLLLRWICWNPPR